MMETRTDIGMQNIYFCLFLQERGGPTNEWIDGRHIGFILKRDFLYPLSYQRDALDDQFQRTFAAQTSIMMEQLNLRGEELSIDMPIHVCRFFFLLLFIFFVLHQLFILKDAVDDQFQHTLHVLTAIKMR